MTTDVAQRHAARLRQLEKVGLAVRLPDGKWRVDAELVTTLDQKDKTEPKSRWVVRRQPLRLDEQVGRKGSVWLDHVCESELAPFGFGADLNEAIARRAEALRGFGIAPAVTRMSAVAASNSRAGGGVMQLTSSNVTSNGIEDPS
jgi:hypothetical protein